MGITKPEFPEFWAYHSKWYLNAIVYLKIIFAAVSMVLQTQGPKSKCYQKARAGYDFPDTISPRGVVSRISWRLNRPIGTSQYTSTF